MSSESELVQNVDFPGRDVNPEPRCHFVLLVDTSGSMKGDKIDRVNMGLEMLKTDLCDSDKARMSIELSIVRFASSVEPIVTFASPDAYKPPKLVASGSTQLAEAIHRGLDLVDERRKTYRQAGLLHYAPWLWALTDGKPTDSAKIQGAAERLRDTATDPVSGKTRVEVFMVGLHDDNDPVDLNVLRQLSPQREPLMLKGIYAFDGMFRWISQSLIAVSCSQAGENVPLQSPTGWGTVHS